MMNMSECLDIEKFAIKIRIETLREMASLGFGHIGGAMSVVDLLAVLYGREMRYDSNNPEWEERDWLILSKGHAGPSLYATLALKGFFPMQLLKTLNRGGTCLPSHCDRNKTPGIDMSTGSLGQGISLGIGISLGLKMDGKKSYVYVIVGDGECQEGQIWEAALYGGNLRLENLIVFIDNNGQQLDGCVNGINSLGDLGKKWKEFGWYVQEIDGHNVQEIHKSIKQAKRHKRKSSVVILNTIKGKGCNFAEGVELNHHMKFSNEQIENAISYLKRILSEKESDPPCQ